MTPKAGGSLSDILLKSYRWVFVDEFQDVTPGSFAFICEIAEQEKKRSRVNARSADNLVATRFCAVGDDDQNIDDFGGASGRFNKEFESHFPTSDRRELTWNYRASGAIISAAERIITPVGERLKTRTILRRGWSTA